MDNTQSCTNTNLKISTVQRFKSKYGIETIKNINFALPAPLETLMIKGMVEKKSIFKGKLLTIYNIVTSSLTKFLGLALSVCESKLSGYR